MSGTTAVGTAAATVRLAVGWLGSVALAVGVSVGAWELFWRGVSIDDAAWWRWPHWLVLLGLAFALGFGRGRFGVTIGIALAASHIAATVAGAPEDDVFGIALVVGVGVAVPLAVVCATVAWIAVQLRGQSLDDRP